MCFSVLVYLSLREKFDKTLGSRVCQFFSLPGCNRFNVNKMLGYCTVLLYSIKRAKLSTAKHLSLMWSEE